MTTAEGNQKTVKVFPTTQVRIFGKKHIESIEILQKGERIAAVGEYDNQGNVIPLFILTRIPKNFPQKVTGMITQTNTDANTFTLVDTDGISHTISIDDATTIRARDTEVSLNSIGLGSELIVFGAEGKTHDKLLATTVTVLLNNHRPEKYDKIPR